jgi:hypothetical protein
MVAMMLPSATPMVLCYARVGRALPSMPNRSARPRGLPVIFSYGWDLHLLPPTYNERLIAPRCLRRWQARAMLWAVSCLSPPVFINGLRSEEPRPLGTQGGLGSA